jgi:Predicted GTPase, probable translation factor
MISVALAGKPNAGKSTFYTAATMADVDVANYPFTTIDANRGMTSVRTDCPCLARDRRCGDERCRDGVRYVPVEMTDVAGLVPGAHEGKGLGNQFLDELTNADVILNVIDASGGTDAEGEPVPVGTRDPVEDINFIEEEMDLWMAGIIGRNWETIRRRARSPDFDLDAALTDLLTGLGAAAADVATVLRDADYPDKPQHWSDADRERLARDIRHRTLPIAVVANKVDVAPPENLERLQQTDGPVIPASADGELALRRAADAGAIEYRPGDQDFDIVSDLSANQRNGLETVREVMMETGGTGVQASLNTAVYDVLGHLSVFPVEDSSKWTDKRGNVLPDAHLLPDGSTPVDLAAQIHSDIADGYLHAVDARSDRQVSDEYQLEEGDVIKIVSAN